MDGRKNMLKCDPKDAERIRKDFVSTIDEICRAVDYLNYKLASTGHRIVAEDIMEIEDDNLIRMRKSILYFKELLDDKNDVILNYVCERILGCPFLLINETPVLTYTFFIKSSEDLFEILSTIKQTRKENTLSEVEHE